MKKFGYKNTITGLVLILFLAACTTPSRQKLQNEVGVQFPKSKSVGKREKFFEVGRNLELKVLLKCMEENSSALEAIYELWQAAVSQVPQAASLPDPRFNYGFFLEEVQTKTGPQRQKVGLSQTFPWFGKLSVKEQIAIRAADAVFQEYQGKRLALFQEVKFLFYEYAYLKQAINYNQEHLELLKGVERVASIRFKSGALPQNVLIQLQVEQGKLEDKITTLMSLRKPMSSQIYAVLGTEIGGVLPWPKQVMNKNPGIKLDDLASKLNAYNPQLNQLVILAEKEALAIELARKSYYPDFTVGVETTDVEGGSNPTAVMFSISIPIWQDKIEASVSEARRRRKSIDARIIDIQSRLQAKFDLLSYYYNDAKRKVSLYDDSLIPKAQQAIKVSLKGFESGKVDYADLLDAQRTLLEFQLTSARQLANAWIKAAELDSLILVGKNKTKTNGD